MADALTSTPVPGLLGLATTMGTLDATTVVEGIKNATEHLTSDIGVAFHSFDYVMFVGMMLLSVLIGVYYGFFQKQDSVSEYLLGGQTMGIFPIAMSMIASNVSGITMLGVPSEMYNYGTQFFLIAIMIVPMTYMIMVWFMPMFYHLQFASSFEYLEHRFDRFTRQLASILYAIGTFLYMPVVIYVPCLALNQVTGISVHIISPIACIVCVFYTTLGGLKAVVWTDALQLVLLCIASIVVMILGLIRVGGLGVVWERSAEGGRLELFNMDPSPYSRCTFWGMLIASVFTLTFQLGTSPSTVQRYLCVPSIAAARRTCIILAFGYFLTKLLSCATGLIIYATYYYCDPLHKDVGVVHKQDQLVPYYVMDVASSFPGLAGLFVAGVFSAALSTMSACLNTLSGTMYKDFIEKLIPWKVSDERASLYMKFISFGIGMTSVVMILLVEKLGGVLQIAISLGGVTGGAKCGLFLLGMFCPWTNAKGASAGAISSVVAMTVIVGGNAWAQAQKLLFYPTLPTRTDGCLLNTTMNVVNASLSAILTTSESPLSTLAPTSAPLRMPNDADVFPLFKVSYMYFGPLGVLVTFVVGSAVSYMTGGTKIDEMDPALFSPAIARWLPKRRKQAENLGTPMEEYKVVATKEMEANAQEA